MPISRQEARDLMSRAYEMGASVLSGTLQRGEDGAWTVDDKPIEEWLAEMEDHEVTIVAATVGESKGTTRRCQVCGTEYTGYECPRCRQARQRLRGRL